jgi:hypothetical protein
MTGEEMERAIEFLLQGQANFETRLTTFEMRLERLTDEVRETNERLRIHAETQTEFIKVVTRHIEEQTRINEAQARINAEFRATQTRIANALDSLATSVNRFMEGRS